MFCTQCGKENDDHSTQCAQCQATLYRPGSVSLPTQAATIPNYLPQSILVTLCCCVVPGIVAIVYAAQVNGFVRAGDFAGARRASRLAYIWSWVGFGLGLAVGLIYVVLALLGVAVE